MKFVPWHAERNRRRWEAVVANPKYFFTDPPWDPTARRRPKPAVLRAESLSEEPVVAPAREEGTPEQNGDGADLRHAWIEWPEEPQWIPGPRLTGIPAIDDAAFLLHLATHGLAVPTGLRAVRLPEALALLRRVCATPEAHLPETVADALSWLAHLDGLDVPAHAEALPALLAFEGIRATTAGDDDLVVARLALGVSAEGNESPSAADVETARKLKLHIRLRARASGGAS